MTVRSTLAPAALLVLAALAAAGCRGGDDGTGAELVRRTPVTTADAVSERVDAIETTVGRLEAIAAPALSAETSGRVVRLLVDGGTRVKKGEILAELDGEPQRLAVASARANVERLEALLENQSRTVKRYRELRSQAVSESMLEEAVAQQSARQAELNDARARLAEAEYRLDRTRVRSPVDAVVERRLISVGDYVSPGTPIVTIVGVDRLRAVLPFPERMAGQLRPGLPATLEQPTRPGQSVAAAVTEVRPMVGTNNRAVEALVELPPSIDWPPGGTVTAHVVLASRDGVVVPAASVVRRPAGDVVYVLQDEKVTERIVTVGIRGSGRAEILSGVEPGETVVLSGAGFLTDGALVTVRSPAATDAGVGE